MKNRVIDGFSDALDEAVRVGDIDEACAQAKYLAAATGMPKAAVGRAAIICLVKSVERVIGDLPATLRS